ncbi:MAG: PadR family transcriptional regulator [Bacteroidales bacterium]|nr:PadR family transcriptional regulator [Bacteroidales bacterium]
MKNTNTALTEAIYYILLALQEPLHGYGIMQKTSMLSSGRLSLSAGTLYGAISNLLDKGWIAPCGESSDSEGRKKMYLNTEAGNQVLRAEFERLEELVDNGKKYIKTK